MDFVILKINGHDLSSASHDTVLRVFQSAREPITVEVARQNQLATQPQHQLQPSISKSSLCSPSMLSTALSSQYSTSSHTYDAVSVGPSLLSSSSRTHSSSWDSAIGKSNNGTLLSTNDILNIDGTLCDAGFINDSNYGNVEDDMSPLEQIFRKEIILRKQNNREIFGLTLSYSSTANNNNGGSGVHGNVFDTINTSSTVASVTGGSAFSAVYISGIEPNTVASREPWLHIGDQILQINNVDVYTKSQVVYLFQQSQLEVKLLVCKTRNRRCLIVPSNTIANVTTPSSMMPLVEEAEYSCVYDEVDNTYNGNDNDKTENSDADDYEDNDGLDCEIGRGNDDEDDQNDDCDSEDDIILANINNSNNNNNDSGVTTLSNTASTASSLGAIAGLPTPPTTTAVHKNKAHQIAQMMKNLALEYRQLRHMLVNDDLIDVDGHDDVVEGVCETVELDNNGIICEDDHNIDQIHPLPPPIHQQHTSARSVPRMGTKLTNVTGPTMAVQYSNTINISNSNNNNSNNTITSGSNTSAYGTGGCTDNSSSRSSPLVIDTATKQSPNGTKGAASPPPPPTTTATTSTPSRTPSKHPLQTSISSNTNFNTCMTTSFNNSTYHSTNIASISDENHYYDVYNSTITSSDQSSSTSLPQQFSVPHLYNNVIESSSSSLSPGPGAFNISTNISSDHRDTHNDDDDEDESKMTPKMEWVIKRRPDGTRYITRRPIRPNKQVTKDRKDNGRYSTDNTKHDRSHHNSNTTGRKTRSSRASRSNNSSSNSNSIGNFQQDILNYQQQKSLSSTNSRHSTQIVRDNSVPLTKSNNSPVFHPPPPPPQPLSSSSSSVQPISPIQSHNKSYKTANANSNRPPRFPVPPPPLPLSSFMTTNTKFSLGSNIF